MDFLPVSANRKSGSQGTFLFSKHPKISAQTSKAVRQLPACDPQKRKNDSDGGGCRAECSCWVQSWAHEEEGRPSSQKGAFPCDRVCRSRPLMEGTPAGGGGQGPWGPSAEVRHQNKGQGRGAPTPVSTGPPHPHPPTQEGWAPEDLQLQEPGKNLTHEG